MSMSKWEEEQAIRVANMKFPWIDPDPRKAEQIVHRAYLAVKNEASHKSIVVMTPCHTNGLEKVEGHDWELYSSNYVLATEQGVFYYGMFVEGIGAFNAMVHESNIRALTEEERKRFSGRSYGMYSGIGGDLSYTMSLPKELGGSYNE